MKHIIKNILRSLLFILSIAQAQITSFNPHTDFVPVTDLIKAHWAKLFTMPSYDAKLIEKILLEKHPGYHIHRDKQLIIKVLSINNKIVGFVTYYYIHSDTCHIELLAIDKNQQSHGYGKQLIEHVIGQARTAGAHTVELFVYTNNQSAIDFYLHLGFQIRIRYNGYLLVAKSI